MASQILLLHPGDPPLFVARLPDYVDLPVPGASRNVHIVHSVYTHIIERRLVGGDDQVALVLQRIPAVVAAPSHCGSRTDDPRRIELYKLTEGDPAGVCVGIKCLDGEAWISTAFPLGVRSLVKAVRAKRLRPLFGG